MPEIDQRVGYLLKRAQHAFRLRMDTELDALGMTTSQYAVLSALEAEDDLSNADLARRSFVTPQTMIRIVKDLEEKGLLTRRPRPGNARVLDAIITRAGRTTVRRAHQVVSEIEERMTAGLSPARIQEVTQDLLDMAANLES